MLYITSLYKTARTDFKRHFLFVLILCLGMLPLAFHGYSMYLLILLFPTLLNSKFWDGYTMLVFLFGITYTVALLLGNQALTTSTIIFYSIYPLILYQAGVWASCRFLHIQSISLLVGLMVVFLGIQAIIANISDAITTGKLINISREVVFNQNEDARSATGYGMMLSLLLGCLGLILVPTVNKADKSLKLLLVVGSILALFCTIHLLNRTGLALAIISLFTTTCLPPHTSRRSSYVISICSLVFLVYYLFFSDTSYLFDVVEAYSERDRDSGSINSMGGREDLWLMGIQQILDNPLGGSSGLFIDGQYNYAHNLIIDGGLRGGIICSIMLIIFLIQLLICNIKLIKHHQFSAFTICFFVLISVTLFFQFMVEPVIEGVPQLFWFSFFILGVLKRITCH